MVDSSQEYETGRNRAVQEQGATEVHARQTPPDSPEVGQAHEQEAVQKTASQETEVPPVTRTWVPLSDPIEARGGWPVDKDVFNTPDPVWPGMPRAAFKEFGLFLRYAADKVGLRDWAFNLRWTPYEDNDEAMAAIKVVSGQKRATVWLCKDFADLPEPQQRHALVHELLHCHFEAISEACWGTSRLMGEPAHIVFRDTVQREIELAVDAIASEWATTFSTIADSAKEDA